MRKLKGLGYWVRGVDLKEPEFSPTDADEFLLLDLRQPELCRQALAPSGTASAEPIQEVYQLAADMGGMGFIHSAECEIMVNSALANLHMIQAAADAKVHSYFFSSSACVYSDQAPGSDLIDEEGAYPALPDNEYGWEKLYAERVALAFARNHGLRVRIARFQNCYGPEGTWEGGREKAPAAICRKVAEAKPGERIPVWGDGSALRVYTYVDDMVEGIVHLMRSAEERPTNLGGTEITSVTELAQAVIELSGKDLGIAYVDGPVGVQARHHSMERCQAIGWHTRWSLREGLAVLYPWVKAQAERNQAGS
ncbi:MAG: NAD-dependent epimerase/dehydratase family protein [Planctomycetes bacterium]|nr:NAD-dependent epimerase/dehydratase family protein [Planctomycetota bacterium]